tara:strand:- start:547 stop:1161 length:615 start_codon:yes stop_codon:yes gene_type:complete
MAAGDTDVSICSEALILLGQSAITSFDDGTAGSGEAAKIYPKVKSATLGMYPWTFTLAKVQLSRLADAPTNVWQYAYALPSQMLTGVPRRVFASDSVGATVIKNYEIQGSSLLTDFEKIFVDFQQTVDEQSMPDYFVKLLTYQMAWHLAIPITDQATMLDTYRTIALGTLAESGRGGYFRTATSIDSAGQSTTVIGDYLLTEVR